MPRVTSKHDHHVLLRINRVKWWFGTWTMQRKAKKLQASPHNIFWYLDIQYMHLRGQELMFGLNCSCVVLVAGNNTGCLQVRVKLCNCRKFSVSFWREGGRWYGLHDRRPRCVVLREIDDGSCVCVCVCVCVLLSYLCYGKEIFLPQGSYPMHTPSCVTTSSLPVNASGTYFG